MEREENHICKECEGNDMAIYRQPAFMLMAMLSGLAAEAQTVDRAGDYEAGKIFVKFSDGLLIVIFEAERGSAGEFN